MDTELKRKIEEIKLLFAEGLVLVAILGDKKLAEDMVESCNKIVGILESVAKELPEPKESVLGYFGPEIPR